MEINSNLLRQYVNEDEGLRDYQKENKRKIYEAWSQYQSVMLQMPTGTGKTRLFVSIIKDIFRLSRDSKTAIKVLILVHRTELIDQIDEELGFHYSLAHGIIQSGDKERKKYPIQLASVQTLSRRLEKWTDKEFDFIVVDEAHHITADSYQKIISAFPHAKLLGVTATPVRLNGEGFKDTFNILLTSPSVKWFIDKGYLCQYEYYSVGRSSFIQREIDEIKKFSQGDYAESELERVCDNDRIRAQVVKTYLDFANGRKGIVYTINKQHNKNLCAEFNERGVSAVAIDSDTPTEKRERYIEAFRRGEFKIICNVNLFTEGFDCPDIEFIQLARPTKSLALYLQQVGRGLRISDNKEKTLFLDNVGLYNRFGFPSSKRMWKHHFEGRFMGNVREEKEERETSSENVISKPRNQNLEEGHEKVHLIQTSDEKLYYERRKKQFFDWLTAYHEKNLEAYQQALIDTHIEGIGLTSEITVPMKQNLSINSLLFNYVHVYIKEKTKELEYRFENERFYFYEFEGDKIVKDEYRRCNSYEELVSKLDDHVQALKTQYLKKNIKYLSEQYKNLKFTDAELADFIHELIIENESFPRVQIDGIPVRIPHILFSIWEDIFKVKRCPFVNALKNELNINT